MVVMGGRREIQYISHLHGDVFLLLRREFISFFLWYLNLVNPMKCKKQIAIICTRKQNPEGFW